MTSCNFKIRLYDIDYQQLNNEIYGNYEFVVNETDSIFGTIEDIIKHYDEPERSEILKERQIYFKEALRFMFQLNLINTGSFMTP
jgi:hypothetical protein